MFWSCVFGLALVSSVGAQRWTDSEYKVASDGTVSVRSGNLKAVKKPAGSTKNQWQKITNSPGLKGGYYANIQVGGRSGLLLSHPNNGAYTGEQQPSSSHKFAVLVHDGSGDAIGDFERDGGFGELKLSPLNVRTSGRASKIFEEDLEADGDYERGHADGSVFLELGESLEYPIGPVGPYAPFFLPWTAFAVLNPFLFGAAPLAVERGSKRGDRNAPLKSPI
jgi:hypothetical protein